MNDRDAQTIHEAYAGKLCALYETLFAAYVAAAGDAALEAQADAAFGKGLAVARKTRDRALALA